MSTAEIIALALKSSPYVAAYAAGKYLTWARTVAIYQWAAAKIKKPVA